MTSQPMDIPLDPVAPEGGDPGPVEEPGALDVFRNRPFLLLWLSQLFTQVGANMVLFGLTVVVVENTGSTTATSLLILSFLVPAVLFSAVAGVYVDRLDKRGVLIATNLIRAVLSVGLYLVGGNFLLILVVNVLVSTATVFFAPAEAAMIPQVVPRKQLLSANGIFTLTLNAAFAIGFALLGPLVAKQIGPQALILVVGFFYLVATVFCFTLPASPPGLVVDTGVDGTDAAAAGTSPDAAGEAVTSTLGQLREGIAFIRVNPQISWSLLYLGIAASLVGVLGVLGPTFATQSLGLEAEDFVVVVLPLAFGIVMGILILNNFGRLLPRRRIIEFGLVALGTMLFLIAAAGPISRWLEHAEVATGLTSLSGVTSLLSIVVFVALLAGIAYAFVAIPAQTQLQEDLPEDVRGRVFGVLNMLVSTASFLPIIIVGPIADVVGTTIVIYVVAILIAVSGVVSIIRRGPLKPQEARARATGPTEPAGLDPVAVATASEMASHDRRADLRAERRAADAAAAAAAASAAAADASAAPVTAAPAAPADVSASGVPATATPETVEGVRGDPSEDE